MGIYLGVALSSLTILIVNQVGWRNSYRIASGVSIGVTLVTFLITEPKRGTWNSSAKKKKVGQLENDKSRLERFWSDIKTVLSNWVFIFLCAAAALRFFGGYALGFWVAKFFKKVYPDYQDEFSIINAITTIVLGVSSAYIGGAIGDYYQATHPEAKAFVSGFGPLVSFPFIFVSFIIAQNFWFSISMYSITYFPAEMWLGASVAMIQNIFPAEIIGTANALFGLMGGLSGALSNFLLGLLGDHFNTDDNPQAAGYLLTSCLAISYLGCAPLFVITGIKYRRFIFKEKELSIILDNQDIKDSAD